MFPAVYFASKYDPKIFKSWICCVGFIHLKFETQSKGTDANCELACQCSWYADEDMCFFTPKEKLVIISTNTYGNQLLKLATYKILNTFTDSHKTS